MDAGVRAKLFREVNDRIFELVQHDAWDGDSDFLCECGDECGCRVALGRAVFETLRRSGRPVLAPGCTRGTTRSWRAHAASGRPVAST